MLELGLEYPLAVVGRTGLEAACDAGQSAVTRAACIARRNGRQAFSLELDRARLPETNFERGLPVHIRRAVKPSGPNPDQSQAISEMTGKIVSEGQLKKGPV